MIRIDSPSDIVFADDAVDATAIAQKLFGRNLQSLPSTKTVEQWKALGTQAFKNKEWFQASIAFSEGLKIDSANPILILNRAETYIRIGWFNSALADARQALDTAPLPTDLRLKAVGRAARSCYYLGKYDDAVKFTSMLPEEKELNVITLRCHRRQRERELGECDWTELCRGSRQGTFRPDIADYIGPIEVREVENMNGHCGMFVSRDIEAGELLVSCKTFFFPSTFLNSNFSSWRNRLRPV